MAVRSAVLLIGLVAFVAGIGRMEVRAQGTDDLAALSAQVSQLHGQGRYAEAIPIAERHVALARQKLGEGTQSSQQVSMIWRSSMRSWVGTARPSHCTCARLRSAKRHWVPITLT